MDNPRAKQCGECKPGFVVILVREQSNNILSFHSLCTYCGKKNGPLPYAKNIKYSNHPFFGSREWLELRYSVLRKSSWKCMSCNRDRKDGIKLHVDHIKPRSKYPELALDINNLQVLCEDCNVGKSNKYEDDFRAKGGQNV
jgi:5-methylcytosine-specific restriction endonuclease McrA